MSRTARLIFLMLIGEMALVALATTLWRAEALANFGALSEHRQHGLVASTLGLWLCPVWGGIGLLLTTRRLCNGRLRMADDQRRYAEITMVGAGVLAAVVQAWMAAGALMGGVPPGREFGLRVIVAFTGVFFMVSANFVAKSGPPTGQGAPDPGAWTRSLLRMGWVGVACGLAVIASAVFMPKEHLVWGMLTPTLVYVAASLRHHLAMRRTAV